MQNFNSHIRECSWEELGHRHFVDHHSAYYRAHILFSCSTSSKNSFYWLVVPANLVNSKQYSFWFCCLKLAIYKCFIWVCIRINVLNEYMYYDCHIWYKPQVKQTPKDKHELCNQKEQELWKNLWRFWNCYMGSEESGYYKVWSFPVSYGYRLC